MADINQQSEQFSELLERLSDDLRRFGRTSDETASALKAHQAARDKELKTAGKTAADALSHVGSAVAGVGKAMLDGEKGAAAFNSSLDDMAMAAKAVGVTLTFADPGGPLIRGLVAGFTAATTAITSYTKAANEMSDKLYKGFNGLANSGAAASDGMTGLFRDAKKLGLSMNELDGFVQLMGENSKDLALFGGTVFEGRKKFASVGAAMEPYRESLMKAGMTQEQINQGTMGYIRLQSQIGMSQTQTTEQLAEGARKYLVEQDALTKLTGMTRADAEKAREAIRSQERFAGKLEELRQAKKFKEAEQLERAYLILYSKGKEAAQGFADLSTGFVQTDAAQKSFMATQGKSMEATQKIQSGQMSAAEGAQMVAEAHGKTAKGIGVAMAQQGTFNQTFGKYDEALAYAAMAQSDIVEQDKKIAEQLKKQGVTGEKAADQLLEDRAKLIKTQQDANKAMEEFVFKGVEPAQKAMIAIAEAAGAAVRKLTGQNEETSGGEQAGAFTEEEKAAAQPMLAKAQQERDIYASEEFKTWQKEQGAGMLQKGMYHEKYGVGAYMKEKGIEAAKPVERATGSLGTVGKLIEDFGPGTPAILHGREGVVTEDQMKSIIKQAGAMGSVTGTTATDTASTDTKNYQKKVKESSDLLDEQNDVDSDTLSLKKENYTSEKRQAQIRIDLGKKEKLLADEDVRQYRSFVDEKNLYYEDLLDFIDEQFGMLENTSGRARGGSAGGGSADGGSGGGGSGGGGGGAAGIGTLGGRRRHRASAETQGEEPAAPAGSGLGAIAERFETGGKGSGIVGWDSTGGTSYGKYQIASKTGAMDDFLKFIKDKNPEIYEKLKAAGPADAGKGGNFAQVWQELASSGAFGNLEEDFIKTQSYDVTMKKLSPELQKFIESNEALKQMLFSTSVQHGGSGAAGILNKVWKPGMTEEQLVQAVYGERATRFGSSTPEVQQSVQNRFARESKMVTAGLSGKEITAADGGMFAGPTSGYPATLHGTEAVIPLKDGAVPVQMPGMDVVATQNAELRDELATMRQEMKELLGQLTEAVNTAKNSGTKERMVAVLENISRSQSTNADLSRKLVQTANN